MGIEIPWAVQDVTRLTALLNRSPSLRLEDSDLATAGDASFWMLLGAVLLLGATLVSLLVTRRLARRLSVTEGCYRRLTENSKDVAFHLDAEGRVRGVNAAVEAITGRSVAAILHTPFADLAFDEAARAEALNSLDAIQDADSTFEILVLDPHGAPRSLEVHAFRSEQGEIRGIARDMSLHSRLTRSAKEIERLEEMSRRTAWITHDFQNLLTVLIGYADQLRGQLDECPFVDSKSKANWTDDLRTILDCANQASLLTQQLMSQNADHPHRPELLDLNDAIESAMANLSPLLPEDISYVQELHAEEPSVFADRSALAKVILNLCINARDAMPDGGTLTIRSTSSRFLVETRIDQEVLPVGKYVLLSIADTGVGMDATTRARIFDAFFTTKEFGRGTGLGLSTVRASIERASGHIQVASEPGRGTTFTIYLPWSDQIRPVVLLPTARAGRAPEAKAARANRPAPDASR